MISSWEYRQLYMCVNNAHWLKKAKWLTCILHVASFPGLAVAWKWGYCLLQSLAKSSVHENTGWYVCVWIMLPQAIIFHRSISSLRRCMVTLFMSTFCLTYQNYSTCVCCTEEQTSPCWGRWWVTCLRDSLNTRMTCGHASRVYWGWGQVNIELHWVT